MVPDRHSAVLDGVHEAREDDGTGALDVVVEGGVYVAVPLERWEGVLEVFELDDDAALT